jgi:hypothetical protein
LTSSAVEDLLSIGQGRHPTGHLLHGH